MKSTKKARLIVLVLAIILPISTIYINENQRYNKVDMKIRSETNLKTADIYVHPSTRVTDHLWSPNGTKLAYIIAEEGQSWLCDLWVADWNGEELVNNVLINSEAAAEGLMDWQDEWILFMIDHEEGPPGLLDPPVGYYGGRELWRIRYDGTGMSQVTFTFTNGIKYTENGAYVNDGSVSWGKFIPGEGLVYFKAHNGNGWWKSFLCNDDGTDSWSHVSSPYYAFKIAISPTGNKLLWGHQEYFNEPTTIMARNLYGTTKWTIKSFGYRPSFLVLADGNTVIWSYMDNIYAIDMDGSNERTVIDDEYNNVWVNYNPVNGQELIMKSNRTVDENLHLFSIQVNGTGIVQLTEGPYNDEYPIISPDGQYLSYRRLPENYTGTVLPHPYELVIKRKVEETIDPTWDETSSDQTVEVGDNFTYDVNAEREKIGVGYVKYK